MTSPRSKSIRSDGKLALGVCVGFFIAISIYLSFELLDGEISRTELMEFIPAILTLLVALVSLVLSYHALSEQRLLRQAGTDPVVLVHLGSREDARTMSTLEVTNVGAGAARNVRLHLITDISKFVPDRILHDFKMLHHTIRTIPQDHSVSYNFGIGHKLLADPAIPLLEIEVSYEDIEGEKHNDIQIIDVKELKFQRADDFVLTRLTKATEQTAKYMKDFHSGLKPLHVRTETRTQATEREEKERAQLVERSKSKG